MRASGVMGHPSEYLNEDPDQKPNGIGQVGWSKRWKIKQDTHIKNYLFQIGNRTITKGVWGIKGTLGQYRRLAEHAKVDRLIVVQRRSIIRQAISLYRAQATGAWIVRDHKEKPAAPEFDLAKIRENMRAIINAQNRIGKFVDDEWLPEHGELRLLFFEDVIAKPFETLGIIADYLGLNAAPFARPTTQKLSDKITDEWENNYYDAMNRDHGNPVPTI